MTMMDKMGDLLKLDRQVLKQKLQDLRGQLFVLRFQIASGKSNKYDSVKKIKKQIARILTIYNQYQIVRQKTS